MCCRVQQFLCGCSLRHGAITATVLGAIVAVLSLLAGIIVLVWKDFIIQNINKAQEQQKNMVFNKDASWGSSFNSQRDQLDQEMKDTTETMDLVLTVIGVFCLIVGLLAGLVTIFLGMSICLNNACLVIPWLVGAMIDIVLSCILVVLGFFIKYFIALGALLGIAFRIYLWIVVYNFHLDLKWNSGRGAAYVSAPMKA